ncbi:DUF6366 family protein [Jeotgalibacillus terrae]|uniref:DUF6366 family protein n=1 Tax=Jeotgalibacillus terrae TaxID=587735 RepID=A0ABW5ZFE4_9BACL|nr:DUF6366 family protein [Jeotgalibacillus terrae]MBM7579339.1 hypothetical protein [Jeotgalibacillus terrae]
MKNESETPKEKREQLQREELNPKTNTMKTTVEEPSETPGRTGIGWKGYMVMLAVVIVAAVIYLVV